MDKITKPNDIFVATLQAPDATTLDLLQNDINASNTSLLTPEEYKKTPMVKKAFTDKNGVFNEEVFNNAYYQAYQKYVSLSDEKVYDDVVKDLEYSSTDRFRPINAKVKDNSAVYTKLRNPQQQAYGIEGVGVISEASKTKEEVAQSNRIYDPEKGEFIDETPESLSLYKKALGDTLIYAKYDEDGYHIDPITGQQVRHYKGEWKTDDEGNYYTEYLGDRELKDNQVVNLQDILTDEDSMWNKLDFYDSDGKDKSAIGITTKLLFQIAPYFIPVVNNYYAAAKATVGLASVLPTFYKSIDGILFGDEPTEARDAATRIENWFRKWEPSKSEEGRSSFVSFESIAGLVGDTVEQLFSQRAVAGAAKYFMNKSPKKIAELLADEQKAEAWGKKFNKLQGNLTLGYMGLTSSADVYNDAINAGYDPRTAGFATLMSASALYGVMQLNASTYNMGTWFLNKTTGYDASVDRGALRKIAKDYMKRFSEGLEAYGKGNNAPLKETLKSFKRKVHNSIDDVLKVRARSLAGDSLTEGFEEVTEEAMQDAVKGMVDFASYMGWTGKEGSFGGWDNVFSKEGLSRYLETFVGGTLGGAVFKGADALDKRIKNMPPELEKDIYKAILLGQGKELKEELKKVKKFFPSDLSTEIKEVNGKQYYVPTTDPSQSQQEIIYNKAVQMINTYENLILRESDNNKYDPNSKAYKNMVENFAERLKETDLEKFIFEDWSEDNIKVADLRKQLREEEANIEKLEGDAKTTQQEKIDKIKTELKAAEDNLKEWSSGKKFLEYNGMGLLMAEKSIAYNLDLDKRTYALQMYDVDYDEIEDSDFKKQIDDEFEVHASEFAANDKKQWKEIAKRKFKAYQTISPRYTKKLAEVFENKDLQDYLLYVRSSIDANKNGQLAVSENNNFERDFDLGEFLKANPKVMSLNGRVKYDLADILIKEGIISIDKTMFKELSEDDKDSLSEKEDPVQAVKEVINHIAAHSRVVVWDAKNIEALLNTAQDYLNNTTSANSNVWVKIYKDRVKPTSTLDLKFDPTKAGNNKAMHTVFTSILDAVKDRKVIDNRTWELVDYIYNYSKTEKQIKAIKKALLSASTLVQKELPQRFGDETTYYINELTGEYSVEAKEGYISIEDLMTKEGAWQLKDFFTPEHLNNITSVEKGLYYINLFNSFAAIAGKDELLIDPTEYMLEPPELELQYKELERRKPTETISPNGNPLISPLVDVAYDIMRNISKRKDISKPLVAWLLDKERDLRTGSLDFSKQVDQEIMKDFLKTLNYIKTLTQMSVETVGSYNYINPVTGIEEISNATTSLNSVLKNYALLYEDMDTNVKKDIHNNYPIFSKENADYITEELGIIANQIDFLLQAYNDSLRIDASKDIERRITFNKRIAERLEDTSFSFAKRKYNFPSRDDDEDDESYALRAVQDLYFFIQENKITPEELHEILDASFGKNTSSKDYYNDGIDIQTGTISDQLLKEFILVNTAINPVDINRLYVKGTDGKSISPLWDQEMAIKYTIASIFNPEHFKGTPLTYIMGSAGSGKTTIAKIIKDALNGEKLKGQDLKVVVSATSQTKTDEFASLMGEGIITHTSDSILGESSIWSIKGSNKVKDEIDKVIENARKGKSADGVHNAEIEVFNGLKVDFSVVIEDGILKQVAFTEDAEKQIIEYINDKLSDLDNTLFFIDEATYLDPLQVQVFNLIAKNKNSRFILTGDPLQLGHTAKIGGGMYGTFSLGIYYTDLLRPHRLSGIFRAQNTAVKENLAKLGDLSKNIEVYDYAENDYNEGDAKKLLDSFSTNYTLQYDDTRGHQITSSADDLINFKRSLPRDGDIILIYDTEEGRKKLEIDFPTSEFPKARFLDIKQVQGAEADYIVSYDITSVSPNNYRNSDIDIKKMYTLASRAKKRALIFESDDTKLFNRYNIKSKYNPTIEDTTTEKSASIWKANLENRRIYLDGIVQKLDTIKNPYSSAVEPTPSESTTTTPTTTSTSPEADVPSISPEPKINAEEDLDDGSIPSSNEVTGGTEIEDEVPEGEEELTDEQKKVLEVLGPDTSLVYLSYVRLGLPYEQFLENLKKTTPSEVFNYCEQIVEKSKTAQEDALSEFEWFIASQWELLKPKIKSKEEVVRRTNRKQEMTISSFTDLVSAYKAFLNNFIYCPRKEDIYYIRRKRRDSSDNWIFKPNDIPKLLSGEHITTLCVEYNGHRYTIGLLGSARHKGKFISSTQNSLKLGDTRIGALEQGVLKDYLSARGIEDDGSFNIASPLIPYTGQRSFKIEQPPKDYNYDNHAEEHSSYQNAITFDDREALKRGEIRIQELLKLGFTYDYITIESEQALKNAFVETDFSKNPNVEVPITHNANNKYVRIRPNVFDIGRKMDVGGHKPFEGIYATREKDPRSVGEILENDKTKSGNIRLRNLNRIRFFLSTLYSDFPKDIKSFPTKDLQKVSRKTYIDNLKKLNDFIQVKLGIPNAITITDTSDIQFSSIIRIDSKLLKRLKEDDAKYICYANKSSSEHIQYGFENSKAYLAWGKLLGINSQQVGEGLEVTDSQNLEEKETLGSITEGGSIEGLLSNNTGGNEKSQTTPPTTGEPGQATEDLLDDSNCDSLF